MSELQPSSATLREGVYSKVVAWEVWNFMSIKYAKAEFDERNIINIKGYNDSGKSAMLRALDVLFFNVKPASQVGFIQDEQEYFRVMVYFDDGVCILRDKYINGQGLYEMYKNNQLLFTTKQNNMLTKITAVPEPIQEYLGLITCDAWNINSRSCFEKQLLVDTTGSENHKSLNEVLRSEESAVAGEMLNSDKNKLKSDISVAENELDVYKRQVKGSRGVSDEFIQKLRSYDNILDVADAKLSSLGQCKQTLKNLNSIPDIPEVAIVDTKRIVELSKLKSVTEQLRGIPDIPEVFSVDSSKLVDLISIKATLEQLSSIPDLPMCTEIDYTRLNCLLELSKALKLCNENDSAIAKCDEELQSIGTDLLELQRQFEELGEKYVVCQNCGAMVSVESEHVH